MSEDQTPLGTLSSGGVLHTEESGGPTPPARRTPWPAIVAIALAVLVVGAAAAGAVLLVVNSDGSDDAPAADTGPIVPAQPMEPIPVEEVPPGETPSLISQQGMAEALNTMIRSVRATKVFRLRVDRGQITALAEGTVLIYRRDGEIQELPGPESIPATLGFPLAEVFPGGPARVDAALRARGEQLDYLSYSVDPVTGDEAWSVFAKSGRGYNADRVGRGLCPKGERC